MPAKSCVEESILELYVGRPSPFGTLLLLPVQIQAVQSRLTEVQDPWQSGELATLYVDAGLQLDAFNRKD